MAINQFQRGPSLGELLGSGLGSGLSTGLQQLAQQKLGQLQSRYQQQQTMSGLQALGFNPIEAQQVAMLPKELQSEVIKNYLRGAESTGLDQALSSLGLGQGPVQQAPAMQQPSEAQQQMPQFSLLNTLSAPRLSSKNKLDIAKFQQKQQMINSKDKALAFKETAVTRKDILDSANADRENNMRIDRMAELNKEGKLSNPLFYSSLKKLGLDIPALLTPESQEFQKLTIDFLKNAKKMFGARISNFEAETFLKSIPSLTQSTEGRARVIHNLKMLYKGSSIRKKAMTDIIKENNGTPPFDLSEQIETRIDPELTAIAAEFKKGFSNAPQGNAPVFNEQVEGNGLTAVDGMNQQPVAKEESLPASVLRNTTRLAARSGEAALGLPGDIESGLRTVKEAVLPSKYDPAQYLVDGIKSGAKRFLGIDLDKINPANYLVDQLKKILPSIDGQILPTSETVRKGITKKVLPKSFSVPQGGWETLADDFVSDATSLLVPVKGKIPFARALKTAGAGNLASTLVKKIGGGEGSQAGAKIGTILLTSMGNPFSFKNHVKTLYPSQAENFADEVNKSSSILNFIHKVKMPVGKNISLGLNPATAVAIGLFSGKVGIATGVMGALYGTGFAERLVRMFATNSELRKSYINLLKSAAAKNATMTARSLRKFDNNMKKEFIIK